MESEKGLHGQPGIESITKQYLYQLAYKKFLLDHKISNVENCFLMPTKEDIVIDKGTVSLEMMDRLDLRKIQVRYLPATKAFECYLNRKRFPIEQLQL